MPIGAKDNGFVRCVPLLATHTRRAQIERVPPIAGAPRAPYALEPASFPLPALAAMAGHAPLGGPREVALACLLLGRLVADATSPDSVLTTEQRHARAKSTRQWLGSAALPASVRTALANLADLTGEPDLVALGRAMEVVMAVTANQLDPAARLEFGRLAQAVAE